ncbi:MAG: divalent-cation tolerance protein CutA [bacterium]
MKVVLTNTAAADGERIARKLVEEHVVACVNLYPVRSVYFWKEQVHLDEEVMLIMKVGQEGVDRLQRRLRELHPYELPEFVVLEVDVQASSRAYVDFVRQGTQREIP